MIPVLCLSHILQRQTSRLCSGKGHILILFFFSMFRKGVDPDFSEALIVRSNSTIEDVCDQVHRTLKETFKYALVWGASARHIPQRVGLGHMVADEDVVSIVAK